MDARNNPGAEAAHAEQAAYAAASAALWGLLARALGDMLDTSGNQELEQAAGAVARCGEELGGLAAEEARLRLEVEYNRLFVRPLKLLAQPFESYYASADENGEGVA